MPEALLRAAHDILKWGPTTANGQPMRILYLSSRESRESLRPALSANQSREDTRRYASGQNLKPRGPRLTFEKVCRFL